jgi:Na+-driven multidrug efflux pump
MTVMTAALRGMGTSFTPLATSLAGVCLLRVVWVYTAVRAFHTLFCLYLSYPVSWAITLAAQVAAYLIIRKKVLGSDN